MQTPKIRKAMMRELEAAARQKMENMSATLAASPQDAREVYKALFPEGLTFTAVKKGTRRVWEIRGIARLGGCTLGCDPTGT